jgi:hypothetical protein
MRRRDLVIGLPTTTRIIPIVMAPAGAPLQSGFVQSLANPGGNVTGLSAMDAEIGGKRLQLLRDLIPGLARVAVLASNPNTDPFSGPFVEDLRLAARSDANDCGRRNALPHVGNADRAVQQRDCAGVLGVEIVPAAPAVDQWHARGGAYHAATAGAGTRARRPRAS